MPARGKIWVAAPLAMLLAAACWGCRAPNPTAAKPWLASSREAYAPPSTRQVSLTSEAPVSKSDIRPVSADEVLSETPDDLFARQSELAVGDYVAEVRR